MKDLLRIEAIGGPIYVPAEQIHMIMPHPDNKDHTLLGWVAGGGVSPSHCTIEVDVEEFAQQLERNCPSIRLHGIA